MTADSETDLKTMTDLAAVYGEKQAERMIRKRDLCASLVSAARPVVCDDCRKSFPPSQIRPEIIDGCHPAVICWLCEDARYRCGYFPAGRPLAPEEA